MSDLPANFHEMTRAEQLAWLVSTQPNVSLGDLKFQLAFERGEHRPDLGPDSMRPYYDDDGNPLPPAEDDDE